MTDLLDDTLKSLKCLPRWLSLSQVAAESGLKLAWLSALSSGAIADPGVRKIQALSKYLGIVPTKVPPEKIAFGDITQVQEPGRNRSGASGVYAFYSGDRCIYVGASMNLGGRFRAHAKNKKLLAECPTHVVVTYMQRPSDSDLKALEKAKIRALNPSLNIAHTERDTRYPVRKNKEQGK